MFQVTKKVKITASVLLVLSATLATILFATQPFDLGKEDRLMTLPPEQVMALTRQRVAQARQYVFFFWMVPFALQRYPNQAFQQMEQDLKTLQTTKDATEREKATYSLRHHSKLIFETVDGQIRKARNASSMIAFGLCLACLGAIFLLFGLLRMMFGFLVVSMFCVGLPIKDHILILALTFFAPICFGLITFWLVRDNPPTKTMPYNNIEEHLN